MIIEVTITQLAAAATATAAIAGIVIGTATRLWTRAQIERDWLTEQRARELHPLRYEVYSRNESDDRFASRDNLATQVAMLRAEIVAMRDVMDSRFAAIDTKLDWLVGRNRERRADDPA